MAKIVKEPAVTGVDYDERADRIRLFFRNDRVLEIPRKDVAELRGLRTSTLAGLKVDNAGMTISLRERDIDVYVPGLLQDLLSLRPAAALGRKGGSRRSAAKARASASNGAKGGRPRKKKTRVGA